MARLGGSFSESSSSGPNTGDQTLRNRNRHLVAVEAHFEQVAEAGSERIYFREQRRRIGHVIELDDMRLTSGETPLDLVKLGCGRIGYAFGNHGAGRLAATAARMTLLRSRIRGSKRATATNASILQLAILGASHRPNGFREIRRFLLKSMVPAPCLQRGATRCPHSFSDAAVRLRARQLEPFSLSS